jgi:hypothetical protein
MMKWKKYTGERFGIGESVSRLVDSISYIAQGGWDGGQMFIDEVRQFYFQEPYVDAITEKARKVVAPDPPAKLSR